MRIGASLRWTLCAVVSLAYGVVHADITLPKVIADGMVLQQGRAIPIWGHAAAGENVSVSFQGEEKSAVADANGNWSVTLSALPTSDQPAEMTIAGANTIRLSDILVGEVWLCGGQSNMEYPTSRPAGFRRPTTGIIDVSTQEVATADYPAIRLFHVEKKLSKPDVTSDGWHPCSGTALRRFSAVGYFFGKELHRELKTPIGLIESDWGGSRIELWTPEDAYAKLPAFKDAPTTRPLFLDESPVGTYYRSMIKPLAPFALRGVIWYQGESNCMMNDGPRYIDKMQALIDSWRSAWNEPAMPFYYVQIAPFSYSRRKDAGHPHTQDTLPEFWEAQTDIMARIPNTGMAVTTDLIDTWKDIHPSNKWDVGHRLAVWALAKTYDRTDVVHSGPTYKAMEVNAGKALITFDNIGGRLTIKVVHPTTALAGESDTLTFFTIAGTDGKFHPAEARIDGERVQVWSDAVPEPAAVRFAWDEHAEPNLFNKAGLPAVPFRTDKPKDAALP